MGTCSPSQWAHSSGGSSEWSSVAGRPTEEGAQSGAEPRPLASVLVGSGQGPPPWCSELGLSKGEENDVTLEKFPSQEDTEKFRETAEQVLYNFLGPVYQHLVSYQTVKRHSEPVHRHPAASTDGFIRSNSTSTQAQSSVPPGHSLWCFMGAQRQASSSGLLLPEQWVSMATWPEDMH